ncbi:unnamed protein product, partial [Symbiodinium natans]
ALCGVHDGSSHKSWTADLFMVDLAITGTCFAARTTHALIEQIPAVALKQGRATQEKLKIPSRNDIVSVSPDRCEESAPDDANNQSMLRHANGACQKSWR